MPHEHVVHRVDHRLLTSLPEHVHRPRDEQQRQHEPQKPEDKNRIRIAAGVGRSRDDRHDDVQHEEHAQRRHHDPRPEAELLVRDGSVQVDIRGAAVHGVESQSPTARAVQLAHAHRLRPARGVYDHDAHALVVLRVLDAAVGSRALSHGGLGLEHGVEVDDCEVHRVCGRPAVGDLEVGRLRGESLGCVLRLGLLPFPRAPLPLPRVDEVLGKRGVAQLALDHPGLATPPGEALRVDVAHRPLARARLAERRVVHEAYPALAALLDVVNQLQTRARRYRVRRSHSGSGLAGPSVGIVVIVIAVP
mmetsp:Transcript_1935/g.8722  ORF Transcript_1935/g.8722 Transcript_1935/m.8722 type:complete len:305 (-) Transcript_1935:191-1105(-)